MLGKASSEGRNSSTSTPCLPALLVLEKTPQASGTGAGGISRAARYALNSGSFVATAVDRVVLLAESSMVISPMAGMH